MKVTRIFTGDDGESHFEDIDIEMTVGEFGALISEPVDAKAVLFRRVEGDYDVDFHNAPRKQYVVNLNGSVEIETGHGERRVLGPGEILLAEDTTGRGHQSRSPDGKPRDCLFIPLA
ncbi:MAG: hypothetical protein RJQ10_16570 [Haliea sp.]|jgi:hypothetical protein|uniref:hypothetical protein n=1 Tax=Haliea sp. TaxID=1932666 RepID=UPI0032EC98FA|tara:strand:+ start:2342 stop:2692 length:351 start_codon:yes stop_codon:yes gene_type:complete